MKMFINTLAVLGVALGSAPLHADSASCLDLAAEVQKLKTQVEALQARVQTLEHSPGKPEASAAPTTAEVAAEAAAQVRQQADTVRQGWKQLKDGMTQDQVKGLLGVPPQTFMLGGKLVWYYNYPSVGAGSVMFNSNGRVVGHQAPPFTPFGLY
jgi:outer membrane murein-binding lipoprotein Lpp